MARLPQIDNMVDTVFKKKAVTALDEALVRECRIKLNNPEVLGDVMLKLAKNYMQQVKDNDVIF